MKKAYLFTVFLMIYTMSYAQSSFEIIAHRGAMGYAMENSIASFEKALELKSVMIELDVFVLPSGEVVVFHDDKLNALTNAKGLIESYTYEELQKVKLKDCQSIPLLTEVLDLCASKTKINIELKGSNTAQPVAVILEDYFDRKILKESDLLISSFKWEELRIMRGLRNDIPIGILTEDDPLNAIPIARELNAVSINPDVDTIDSKLVKTIQDAGFKVFPWTVNKVKHLQRLKDWGVDGAFSNYPDRGKALR